MKIQIEKYWEDLETFDVEVVDKLGDIFMYKGEPWVMTLRGPESDAVKAAVAKNTAELSGWRSRQPPHRRNDPAPDSMLERQTYRIIQASHVAWKNPPTTDGQPPDFSSEEFVEFLKDEPWYASQWQNAWTDRKNSTRRIDETPKKSSSSGAKPK